MKIGVTNLLVTDQEKALQFYTEVLGFSKKTDMSIGPDFRWLTLVSPQASEGTELLLQPVLQSEAASYQKALFAAGSPCIAFKTENVAEEYKRLKGLGVIFRMEPFQRPDGGMSAIFEDGCGNLINLYQL